MQVDKVKRERRRDDGREAARVPKGIKISTFTR